MWMLLKIHGEYTGYYIDIRRDLLSYFLSNKTFDWKSFNQDAIEKNVLMSASLSQVKKFVSASGAIYSDIVVYDVVTEDVYKGKILTAGLYRQYGKTLYDVVLTLG